jgi:hypothetical protein
LNERIGKLADQATSFKEGLIEGKYDIEVFDKEKFAELIVRECIAICKDIDGEEDAMAKCGRQDCAVEIREHFGVK